MSLPLKALRWLGFALPTMESSPLLGDDRLSEKGRKSGILVGRRRALNAHLSLTRPTEFGLLDGNEIAELRNAVGMTEKECRIAIREYQAYVKETCDREVHDKARYSQRRALFINALGVIGILIYAAV